MVRESKIFAESKWEKPRNASGRFAIRPGNLHGASASIYSGWSGRPGRPDWRLASQSVRLPPQRQRAFGETPKAAVGTTAPPETTYFVQPMVICYFPAGLIIFAREFCS
jgi:hypothetical protein